MKNLLLRLKTEGVHLAISPTGNLEATGDRETLEKVLPLLRKHKAELLATLRKDLVPEWCNSFCSNFEKLNLPKNGITPGCVIREPDCETWRRLERLTTCPYNNVWH